MILPATGAMAKDTLSVIVVINGIIEVINEAVMVITEAAIDKEIFVDLIVVVVDVVEEILAIDSQHLKRF